MLVNSYNFNFSPRVGAAWQPFGKWGTVLRGAVGRYIYPVPIREEAPPEVNRNNPFTAGYSESYTSSTLHAAYQLHDACSGRTALQASTTPQRIRQLGAGWPIMGLNSTNVINTASTTRLRPA